MAIAQSARPGINAQAKQQGFTPKAASIGKALLFPVAVEALGEIGGYTAKLLLQQSVLDADESVREAAQQMLAEPGFAEPEVR